MASQIRKGFFFYFGLLVLVLVAVFMVCVVIMMFNPGSSVLWLQYFSSNETIYLSQTSDGSENSSSSADIDFSTISSIEVECGFAQVTIAYDNDNGSNKKTGVYIINNAKGFVTAAEATSFEYSVGYEGDKLIISVSEPNGFLYFSKNIEIIIHSSTLTDSPNFSNIAFKITTTSGDVSVGGSYNVADGIDRMEVASLEVSSTSGDITLTKNFNTESASTLSLSTDGGTISSKAKITSASDGETTTTGIKAGCDVTLSTSSGRIELTEVNVGSSTATITNKSGDVVLGRVYANELRFEECAKGNYALNLFKGTTLYFGSGNTISSPYIDFGKIEGDFMLGGSVTSGKPTVIIDELSGNLTAYALSGSLTVGKASGDIEIESDGSLKVDIVVASNSSSVRVVNSSASVTLGFSTDTASNSVDVVSTSGNVTINFTATAQFVATSYSEYTSASDNTPMSDDKITLSLSNSSGATKNPLSFNATGSHGTMTLVTGGNVYFTLVSADTF